MALTYPLSYTQFLGALRVAEVTFRLSHPQEHTRLGDGTVIRAVSFHVEAYPEFTR